MEQELRFSWSKPLLNETPPSQRGGHSVVFADDHLITFGGHFFSGESFTYLNETWVLDLKTSSWQQIRCSGETPSPRYGHSAVVVGSSMIIFGGKGLGDHLYRDLYSLDLLSWEWQQLRPISPPPPPRMYHASVSIGNKMVVFGGWDGDYTCYNDLHIFNLSSFEWVTPRTQGFPPSPRYGHSFSYINNQLVIFGGASLRQEGKLEEKEEEGDNVPDITLRYLNDVKVLDTETLRWSQPSLSGKPPSPRMLHDACPIDASRLAVTGGWGTGGLQTKALSIASSSSSPSSLVVLDLANKRWVAPRRDVKRRFPGLYSHKVVYGGSDGFCLCFGGFDGKKPTNTLIVLEFDL